ncbi:MAG: hypothetical protein MJZ60_03250 [Bacteroidaceae bacterium]|nr:hypothetical protein [Bacteroidaceae bacterium]
MKYVFLLSFAMSTFMMCGCKDHTIEDKTRSYLQQLNDAAEAGENEKYCKILDEIAEWNATLSEEEMERCEKAASEMLDELNRKRVEKYRMENK